MKCREPKACFAQDANGNCEILTDTYFLRPCPFWKPPKVVDEDAEFEIAGYVGRWKRIKGYNYLVSTEGQVMNDKHRLLKPVLEKTKCEYRVGLTRNGTTKKFRVSMLVAAAFLPGEGKVFHKNGDRLDCRLENLERR